MARESLISSPPCSYHTCCGHMLHKLLASHRTAHHHIHPVHNKSFDIIRLTAYSRNTKKFRPASSAQSVQEPKFCTVHLQTLEGTSYDITQLFLVDNMVCSALPKDRCQLRSTFRCWEACTHCRIIFKSQMLTSGVLRGHAKACSKNTRTLSRNMWILRSTY